MQVGNESCDRENKHREIVKLLEAILSELKRCETSAPGSTIRILPSCPGSVNVRQYNMRDPESRFAYLLDITDELLSYRNTHLEKDHANNNERVAWLMDQVKYLLERGRSPPRVTSSTIITKPGDQISFTGSCGEHAVYTVQGDGSGWQP
jgi:hypothetical protein